MALKMNAVLVMGLAILSLFSVASAISGTASYYTQYTPSACYGNQDEGTMIAAASDPIYNNGAACGKMYKVTCTSSTNSVPACKGGSVTVKIVDRCPSPGCRATLDLSQEAFSTIANTDAGIINIDYVQV
ncbi:EG45-like domain containing protein [Neltuma alba]|uniref:EG45-like domain containing protein n=1 Tax=Neltuma alba TaxID=207710 RepID=UPI0010A4350B|nr:EG45-like domain containing protein [Prosopis alba]